MWLGLHAIDLCTRLAVLETPSPSEHGNKRCRVEWKEWIEFPIKYRDVEEDVHVLLTVWNVGKRLVGSARIGLFESGSLRRGKMRVSLKCEAHTPYSEMSQVVIEDLSLESRLRDIQEDYKRYKVKALPWLDKLTSQHIKRSKEDRSRDGVGGQREVVLEVESASFDHPVIYEERSYSYREMPNGANLRTEQNNVLNEFEKGRSKQSTFDWENNSFGVFYDPEVIYMHNRTSEGLQENPVAQKYFKLTRYVAPSLYPGMFYSFTLPFRQLMRGLKDPNLKPDQAQRTRIQALIRSPGKLTPEDMNLLWMFRYSLVNDKLALTKFVYSVDWDDENEKLEAAELLKQWKQIDIADALRLLSGEPECRAIEVRAHAVKILSKAEDDELLQYLLQLVQALRYDDQDEDSTLSEDLRGSDKESDPGSNSESKGSAMATASTSAQRPSHMQAGLLGDFLINRACRNEQFASFLNSYLAVEISDPKRDAKRFSHVLHAFYSTLRASAASRAILASLESQATTMKQIMHLCHQVNASPRDKGSVRQQKLQKLLAPGGQAHELIALRSPVPLPLRPELRFVGINLNTAKVMVSNTYPLMLDLVLQGADAGDKGYRVMFKAGDDLRQDQLVLQMIGLMDNMFKAVNLDLHLTTYQVLALSTDEGMVEFVPNAFNLSKVLHKHGSIISFFNHYSPWPPRRTFRKEKDKDRDRDKGRDKDKERERLRERGSEAERSEHARGGDEEDKGHVDRDSSANPEVLTRFIKSCAGYCVITYILGVGDRHLDNLMLKPTGELFHIDFGYILGRDPRSWPTPIRLTKEMIETMGGRDSEGFQRFLSHCCQAYKVLRSHASLILNLFHLMIHAGIPDISVNQPPNAALAHIQDKFNLHMTDAQAETHLLSLLDQSADALAPVIYEMFHRAAIAIK